MFEQVKFDERGLVPIVAQDYASGEVLTLAYASEESLRLTVETGELHFYSRSREEIWRKGETSGNVLQAATASLRLRRRCDRGPGRADRARLPYRRAELLLPRAWERGCCHSPPYTKCWRALERTLRSRAAERPEGSYTVQLLDDPKLIGEKVEEEAEEVVRAAREETDERVAEEAADLLYHLAVLLASREVPQSAAMEVLDGRRR